MWDLATSPKISAANFENIVLKDSGIIDFINNQFDRSAVSYTHLDVYKRQDLSYQSDQSAVQPAFATVGSATQLNLRTGFDFEKASIRLFVNNATNEKSALSGAFTGDPGQRYDFVRGLLGQSTPVGIAAFEAVVISRPPRTYGISISLKY